MTDATKGAVLVGGLLTVGFAVGLGAGYGLYRPRPNAAHDQAHPAVVLPGGGLILQESPTSDALPEPAGLSKTVTVVRRVEVLVKPDCPPVPVVANVAPVEPKPVKVILSLIRHQDSTLRVVATAEGGTVVGGLDIPVASAPIVVNAPIARELRWSVEAERVIPLDKMLSPAWGAVVHYARGPFIGGIGGNRYEIRASLGVRF